MARLAPVHPFPPDASRIAVVFGAQLGTHLVHAGVFGGAHLVFVERHNSHAVVSYALFKPHRPCMLMFAQSWIHPIAAAS